MYRYIILLFILLTSYTFPQFVPEWVQIQTQNNLKADNSELSVMDTGGNIYIANVFDNSGNADIVLSKFNNSGTIVWQKIFNSSPPENHDYPKKLIIDQSGNLVIAGNSNDISYTSNKIVLVKYNNSGVLMSSAQYKRSGNPVTSVSDFINDNNGNIIIAGLVHEDQNFIDSSLVAKFDQNLTLLWSKTFRDTISYYNNASKVNVESSGNIYIASASDYNILTIKYDASGNVIWLNKQPYIPTFYNIYRLPLMFSDNVQNIYICSNIKEVSGNDTSKTILIKYNSSGSLLWSAEYNISNTGTESPRRIFNINSDIYLDINYYDESYLVKINQSGQMLWQKTMDHAVNFMGRDNENKVMTAGFVNSYFRKELSLEKFNPDGSTANNYTFSYNGTGTDNATKFFVTNDNKILTVGYHNTSVMLLKLTPSAAQTSTFVRNNINKSILDSQYIYDTINLSINDLPLYSQVKNVYINIDTVLHSAVGDLRVYLNHESKTDTLVYQRGFISDNFIGTKLRDTSVSPICNSNNAPFTGYYKPCYPLSQFRNLSAGGPWVLIIHDRKSPETGVLKAWSLIIEYEIPIGIIPVAGEIPVYYSLTQNYPNPFNPLTKIRFALPSNSFVNLKIYDINGKEIKTLVNEMKGPGIYETEFDGSDLSSGVYFYKFETGDYSESRKMVLIK